MRTLLSVAMTRLLDDLVPRNWPVGASPMSAAVLVLVMVLPSVRHAASVSVRLSATFSAETTRPKTSRVTRGRLRMVLTTPVTGLVDWPRPPKMPEMVVEPARSCSGDPAFAPLPRIVARPSSGLPPTPSALATTSWLVTPAMEREPTAAPVLTSSPGCEGGNEPRDCTSVGTWSISIQRVLPTTTLPEASVRSAPEAVPARPLMRRVLVVRLSKLASSSPPVRLSEDRPETFRQMLSMGSHR